MTGKVVSLAGHREALANRITDTEYHKTINVINGILEQSVIAGEGDSDKFITSAKTVARKIGAWIIKDQGTKHVEFSVISIRHGVRYIALFPFKLR